MNLFRGWVQLRNIEWAAGDAVLTSDTVVLLEINDAVGVLDDRAVRRAGTQAAGIGAVHALVFAHQPAEVAVVVGELSEADQIVVIPRRIGHGLVGVVENRFMEGIAVPFEASDFAGFAANAGGDIDQLADIVVARCIASGHGTGVTGDGFDLERSIRHLCFLQFHEKALKLGREGIRIGDRG